MRTLCTPVRLALLVSALLLAAVPVLAQEQNAAARPASGPDRLFLSFAEDTALADRQWWEGQLELFDADRFDLTLVRGVVDLQPWDRVGVGARIGFGSSDTPAFVPDGSGATDLDVWAKYRFGSGSGSTEFAVGGVLTVPTGDDTAGLGTDAFAASLFGALRHSLDVGTLAAHAGLRWNGDGQIFGGPDMDGEVSPMVGAAWIVPLEGRITLLGEIDFEGERFNGGDSDVRVLGGLNWHAFERGMLRGAIAFGLTDGAPDAQLLVGYAASF